MSGRRAPSAIVLLMLLSSPVAAADLDEGRRQARAANKLAADGNCAAAVPAFDRAYELLNDPALLFNRAECRRKVGAHQAALNDYRLFLAALPQAPNRRAVEERITALEREVAISRPPAAPSLPDSAPVAQRAWASSSAEGALSTTSSADEAPWYVRMPTWAWVGLGAVVLGVGAAAGYYAHERSQTDVPPSSLGNQRF